MNQQRLLFEYSPAFVIVGIALGLTYAWLLYRGKQPWSVSVNRLLFGLRASVVAVIAFLLVGPILKITQNIVEKPEIIFLFDNSLSVKETVDSLHREEIKENIAALKRKLEGEGFQIASRDLVGETNYPAFTNTSSDLAGAIRESSARYEGKNLAGIVLLSDGIYNSGSSPLYAPMRVPVFTVGLGDTTQRVDLILKNPEFNKIAYQGNKFPLRATVVVEGVVNRPIVVSLFQKGVLVGQQTENSGSKQLIVFDFELEAKDKGLQKIDIDVRPIAQERNQKNNRSTAFIEVVEGKKKILLIAPAPHPDIKAIRAVVEKNSNYEFVLHIPGVHEAEPEILKPGKADLIIFHEAADLQGKTLSLFSRLSEGNVSMLLVIGTGSNLRSFTSTEAPFIVFEKAGQWDEITPVINPAFRDFGFPENLNATFSKYPPANVPFGKFSFPPNASVLLYQQIGNVLTDRPLLFTTSDNGRKTGVLLTDGMWRWRLNEYAETEKSDAFDEVFSKLIQYLSTLEDKRKFRVFPLQHEFTDSEPVLFESQVYNDLFKQVYGNTIAIELKDEKGKVSAFNYVTSPGATRYRVGGLAEGVYQFTASTLLNGRLEGIKGEFLVKAQNIEAQDLTADFNLLRKLSGSTGGTFHPATGIPALENDIRNINAKGLIHSNDSFDPMINLPWVFGALLLLVTAEWFIRKYSGAY